MGRIFLQGLGRRRDRFDAGALGLPHFLLRRHSHEFQVRGATPALLQGAQETSERRLSEVWGDDATDLTLEHRGYLISCCGVTFTSFRYVVPRLPFGKGCKKHLRKSTLY